MSGLKELSLDVMQLTSERLTEYREENQRMKKKMDLNRQIYFVNILKNEVGIWYQNDVSDCTVESRIDSETHFFNSSEDAQKFISEKKKYYEEHYDGIEIKSSSDDSGNIKLDMIFVDKSEQYQTKITVSIELNKRYQCYDNEPFIKIENKSNSEQLLYSIESDI